MSKAAKFIQENTRNTYNYNSYASSPTPWLSPDDARKVVEIARDEMVEKAIKWVEYNNENGGCKFDGWVENIKQAMKDETQNL